MMRVKNDKTVSPPWVALIELISSEQYTTTCKNEVVKRHVWTRAMEFIYESFDRAPQALDQGLIHVLLLALANEDLPFYEKSHIFLLLVHKLTFNYGKQGLYEQLALLIEPIFTQEVKAAFLQMSLYYIINHFAPLSIQPSLRNALSEANQIMI